MTKRKLHSPINENIFNDFIKELNVRHDTSSLRKILAEDEFYSLNLILKRVRLADNLNKGDLFNHVNKDVGGFEESALRFHLLLNCIELSSRLHRSEPHIHFSEWLDKRIKAGADTSMLQDTPPFVNAKIIFKEYNKTYGVNQQYRYFFTGALKDSDKDWLLSLMWAWKSKKIQYGPGLGMKLMFNQKTEDSKFESDMCYNKWLDYEKTKKLTMISDSIYKCRNAYTHGLKSYTSTNDSVHKMEMPESIKNSDSILNKGDGFHLYEENIGLATNWYPVTTIVRACILRVLSNFIIQK